VQIEASTKNFDTS
jgi:hypothetical protein